MPRHNPIHTVFQSDFLRVLDHRCTGEGDAREETTENFEIVLPRSGTYQRRDAHGAFLADPNQILFFNQGEPYEISHPIQGRDSSTVFIIAPSLLAEIMQAHNPSVEIGGRRLFPRSHIVLNARLQALQYRLLRTDGADADTLEMEEEIIASVAEIARALYREDPVKQRSSPSALRVHAEQAHAVKTFLNANVRSNLRLEEISSAVHLSPYHLCRVFKRETGMTLHQYAHRLRLFNAAERMLENPVTRLDALALDFGFANHGHFSVAFRQMFGIAPSDFRDARFREMSRILKA
jgi:AraC-like DNA-binding protein